MMPSDDPWLDQALASVAGDDGLEFPNAALEERLRAAYGIHQRTPAWRRAIQRPLSSAAALILFLALSGLAVGSTIGFQKLKAWWYSIQIDGEAVSGTLEEGDAKLVNFVGTDGYRVSVRVERRKLADASVQTSFDALERVNGHVDQTSEVIREAGEEGGPVERPSRRFDLSVLEEASVLHTWTTGSGERQSLWLGPDLDGEGSWLLLEHPDTATEGPVELLLSTARPIRSGGHVSIQQAADGSLFIELSDGHGWELAFQIAAEGKGLKTSPATEFTTPSGRVRVQTGD